MSGVNVEVQSARSFKNHIVREPNTRVSVAQLGREIVKGEEGFFHDEEFVRGSTYTLVAELEEHWGTLMSGIASLPQALKMFPKKIIFP